LGRMIVF